MGIGSGQTPPRSLARRELLKYGVYSGLAAGLPSSLWLSGCRKQRSRSRPNVVVVLIDTLRPDYLGFYGYKKETAAFLAKIAKKSFVFTRAFSTSSWTAPSTTSLFTSKYPHRHGVMEGFFANKIRATALRKTGKAEIFLNRIPKDLTVLPEIFKSMGYATFGMATNLNISDKIGFDRGFDLFNYKHQAPAEVVYEWVKQSQGRINNSKPFFLYLHPNDVHWPYHKRLPYYTPQQQQREDLKERYQSEIGYTDEYLGKIFETLNVSGNTIFLVISDHGEEFWDHGGIRHRAKLYRELTQVVMLLYAPLSTMKPRRINVNVSLIDVLPTLVELVNGQPVPDAEGLSLAPLLRTEKSAKALAERLRDRTLFAHRIMDARSYQENRWSEDEPEFAHWAAISQNWNLIEWGDSRKELFDHRNDLAEQRNVFLEHPQITSQLLEEIQTFKKLKRTKKSEKISVDLDEKLLENLKSLGYVE
jgi:choline-sulfatase